MERFKIGKGESGNTAWEEKQAKLLGIAKSIYKICSCRAEGITDEQIDDFDDSIYEMMCESCWQKFREKEELFFPKGKSVFLGGGNSEGRMYVLFQRDGAKLILSRLLFSCGLRDDALFRDSRRDQAFQE